MKSHPLEPGRAETLAMGRAAVEAVADFVDGLPQAPATGSGDAETVEALVQRLLAPPGEEPGDFGDLLQRLREAAGTSVEAAGPSYLAYIPGGGLYTSALAEMLARAYNRFTGNSVLSPGPVAMEHGVMRWLCEEFDLPPEAIGVAGTGGSMATLSALVAAREQVLGEDFTGGTLYVTEHTHQCVAKAARVAGFPAAAVRTVPTDADLRMDPGQTAAMVAEDRRAGRRPAVLVATAGTTDTGTVDDLEALADVARAEGLWFHVDAAYGGFFRLTKRGHRRLAGVQRADSIVLDPHKGLFLPFGTGVLLVRDRATLQTAFSSGGHYLQDLAESDQLPHYADLTPELTRESRGPRMWLPLHLHGVAAFRAALDEKLDLAAEAHRGLAADPRIEAPREPELSVVTFRLRVGDDADHRRWLETVNASGRVFLSSTRVDGRFTLRLCVLSHRTHADRVDEAVDIVRSAVPGHMP
jgi:aromatic-L-amino-acid/L-tryptophan decarboxylase